MGRSQEKRGHVLLGFTSSSSQHSANEATLTLDELLTTRNRVNDIFTPWG